MKNNPTKSKQKNIDSSKKTRKQIDKTQEVISGLAEENDLFKQEIVKLQESQRRVLADYQNLVRRNRDERIALIKMANREIVESLLEPLDFLRKAAEQIVDQGLDMAINQLDENLRGFGLEEVKVLGKKFNSETMEVIEKRGDGEKVVEVILSGYRLNDNIIRFAKVVVE